MNGLKFKETDVILKQNGRDESNFLFTLGFTVNNIPGVRFPTALSEFLVIQNSFSGFIFFAFPRPR